jgi:hypothetical protein
MRTPWIAALITSLALTSPSRAQNAFPYACEWVSEVTPDAVIRFTHTTNGAGSYHGALFYRKQRLMGFQENQSQGYGNFWWSSGEGDDRSERVIVFSGNQVVRGTPGPRPTGPQRVLLVGLGSSLWYGPDPTWRDKKELLTAAEGFWRTSPGCRQMD